MTEEGGLDRRDRRGVARLKQLRERSLSIPYYRDTETVRQSVTPNLVCWSRRSRLGAELTAAQDEVESYRRSDRGGRNDQAEAQWARVVAAVDAIIDAGERLHGGPIKPAAF
jgi:hypothetical protein